MPQSHPLSAMNHPNSSILSSWGSASGPTSLGALWWIPSNLFCVEVSRTGQSYPRHGLTSAESRGITFSLSQVMPLFMPPRAWRCTTTSCTACFPPGLPGLIHSSPSPACTSITSSSFQMQDMAVVPVEFHEVPVSSFHQPVWVALCSLPIYRSCHL